MSTRDDVRSFRRIPRFGELIKDIREDKATVPLPDRSGDRAFFHPAVQAARASIQGMAEASARLSNQQIMEELVANTARMHGIPLHMVREDMEDARSRTESEDLQATLESNFARANRQSAASADSINQDFMHRIGRELQQRVIIHQAGTNLGTDLEEFQDPLEDERNEEAVPIAATNEEAAAHGLRRLEFLHSSGALPSRIYEEYARLRGLASRILGRRAEPAEIGRALGTALVGFGVGGLAGAPPLLAGAAAAGVISPGMWDYIESGAMWDNFQILRDALGDREFARAPEDPSTRGDETPPQPRIGLGTPYVEGPMPVASVGRTPPGPSALGEAMGREISRRFSRSPARFRIPSSLRPALPPVPPLFVATAKSAGTPPPGPRALPPVPPLSVATEKAAPPPRPVRRTLMDYPGFERFGGASSSSGLDVTVTTVPRRRQAAPPVEVDLSIPGDSLGMPAFGRSLPKAPPQRHPKPRSPHGIGRG